MSIGIRVFTFGLSLAAALAFAQTKPAFEVATIKPAAPLDMAKMMAAIQAGQPPKIGPHIGTTEAEYSYMSLRDLIALAYGLKPYQVTGPDWLANQRFDILAKMPDGAAKDDAPRMLQTLLEERFRLAEHRSSAEHPVLALVVAKGGPKLKESSGTPKAIDENSPLKPGEVAADSADGPLRMTVNRNGGGTINMGVRGIVTSTMDPATSIMRLDARMITMGGFADMLTQFSQMMGGAGPQFVDMTGLQGHYDVAVDFSQADRANISRSMGLDTPNGAGGEIPAASPTGVAADPGGTSLIEAVQALGLKLEKRKAMVEQLIVDRVEKTPTAN